MDSFQLTADELADALVHLCWYDVARAGGEAGARVEACAWMERALERGLPVRFVDGERRFDAVKALTFLREEGLAGVDPVWKDRAVALRRREAAWFAGETLTDATDHHPRRITLVYTREIVRADLAPGRVMTAVLPLPEDEPTQRAIVIQPIEERGAQLRLEGRALLRRGPLPADRTARVGARISFTATARARSLGATTWPNPAPELQPYLSRDEGLIRVTPSIASLAAMLRREDPRETMRAFWSFALERLRLGVVRYDELDAADPLASVLDGRWVDCFVAASFLAALCRAVGLPARLVQGFLLTLADMGPHFWLEVLLPPHGWVPFDTHAFVLAAGDRSGPWADSMFGRLPHQLVFYRLPLMQPQLGLRLPTPWFCLRRFGERHSTRNEFRDAATGALLCAEQLEWIDAPA